MSIRRDLHLYNEATGWLLTSTTRNGHPPTDFASEGGAKWKAAVEDGSIIPLGLYQDDALDVRVVVDEPLTADEAAEWVDRVTWKLVIPDGQLVLSGGTEWLCSGGSDGEYAKTVDVPTGTYRVDVYTFLAGVNGAPCLAKAGMKETGMRKWFGSTRPGVMPPGWLAERIGEVPPSAEEQARRDARRQAEEENRAAREKSWHVWGLDPAPAAEDAKDERVPLDFLVHLTPLRDEPPHPVMKKGWFAHIQSPRVPERCPLGLFSELVPQRIAAPAAALRASVRARVEGRTLRTIPGGPVPLDVATELALPFWIALLCKPDLIVELRVETEGAGFEPHWPPSGSGISATRMGEGWTIAIDAWGHHVIRPLHRLGALLSSVPDGSTLEMNVAPDPAEDSAQTADKEASRRDAGVHRYRGAARGGAWLLAETSQPVGADALRDALALAREVDAGGPVTARSDEEADAMWADLVANGLNYKMGKLFGNSGVVRDGWSLRGRTLMDLMEPGVVAFRQRFRGVWPLDRAW